MAKDTRWRIIYAAMELFWLKGYASTSIADILSRSQVNSGSLYYFFPGKQDVLIAVLEASDRFESGTDLRALAELTLNVMEGGVMQARTYRDVSYFDRAIAQLRK